MLSQNPSVTPRFFSQKKAIDGAWDMGQIYKLFIERESLTKLPRTENRRDNVLFIYYTSHNQYYDDESKTL